MNQRERAVAEDMAGQEVNLAVARAEFANRIKKARRVEAEIVRIIASAEDRSPIQFKSYRTFHTLFESASVVEDLSNIRTTDVHTWNVDELLPGGKVRKGTGCAVLDSFCSVRNTEQHLSLNVFPRKAVIDLIGSKMMLADQYRINFEIVVHKGGTALVTAHYNQITGSRWLAVIHSDTIPGIGR